MISVLSDHWSTESRVLEATYFGVLLIQLADGSPADVGSRIADSAVEMFLATYG